MTKPKKLSQFTVGGERVGDNNPKSVTKHVFSEIFFVA